MTNRILKFVYILLFLSGLHLIFLYKYTLLFSNDHNWFFQLYIILTGAFLLSRFFIVYFYDDSHKERFDSGEYPTLSFVIAGKNEEDSIYKTIEAVMKSEYPNKFECIAVNDGSTDGTLKEMNRAGKSFGNISGGVRVIHFPENRGKREGMAEGVICAEGEIIIFVDSDSFLEPASARLIVEHFLADPRVGAVSGNTGVANPDTNALTKMQAGRYAVSFDIFKACESVFGVVTCCPGCFSAYRRSAVMAVLNAWRTKTFLGTLSTYGDDRSLTNFILAKWKVVYCRSAHATTIVPDTYGKFMRQQLRWKKSWLREGSAPGRYIWKRNPIASFSFYTNWMIPVFSPLVAFNAIFIQPIVFSNLPVVFFTGLFSLSILLGFFNYLQTASRYWIHIVTFTVFYVIILIWQMPYALLKLKNTSWGTR